jgi:ELWxxDGT repeat protein
MLRHWSSPAHKKDPTEAAPLLERPRPAPLAARASLLALALLWHGCGSDPRAAAPDNAPGPTAAAASCPSQSTPHGTPSAPHLVKDFSALGQADVCGTLFFVANDRVHGYEVWRSDGTEQGTALVKDINPDSRPPTAGAVLPVPRGLRRVGRRLFFAGDDGTHGLEPWVSDGTEAGTHLVKDINPGSSSSLYDGLDTADLDGVAFFAASDPVHGSQLWRSDGTEQGTTVITEFAGTVSPTGVRSLGGLVYFHGNDGVHGDELWRTDGTRSGTFLLRDINPDGGSGPSGLVLDAAAGLVHFTAHDGAGRDLWRTDGTAAGTTLVARLPPGLKALSTRALGQLFLWAEDPPTGREVWASDGTAAGTRLVEDILPGPDGSNPEQLTALENAVLFAASDGVHGKELWRTDGTAQGTLLVRDLRSGPASAFPNFLTRVGDRIYFQALDASGASLYMSDGTEQGTQAVPGTEGLYPSSLVLAGNRLFFGVTRGGLWAIDLAAAP